MEREISRSSRTTVSFWQNFMHRTNQIGVQHVRRLGEGKKLTISNDPCKIRADIFPFFPQSVRFLFFFFFLFIRRTSLQPIRASQNVACTVLGFNADILTKGTPLRRLYFRISSKRLGYINVWCKNR